MAGVNETIDSVLSLTDKYQLTDEADILTIIGATVTFNDPAGEIFTEKGNDTVSVKDSTITNASGTGAELAFYLGSGDDSITVENSTFKAGLITGSGKDSVTLVKSVFEKDISAGSGDDFVRISGDAQSEVTLNGQLLLGTENDTLTLSSILLGKGNIEFGEGIDTLVFDSGSLNTTGTLTGLENLTVTAQTGKLGMDLELSGTASTVTLNGNLTGSDASRQITVNAETTSLITGNNVKTNVGFVLNKTKFIQSSGGTLEFDGVLSSAAFLATDSQVTLHDIIVSNSTVGYAFKGTNTVWVIKDSNIANGAYGIYENGGSVDLTNVGISNVVIGLTLSNADLTGADVSFTNNSACAISASQSDIEIEQAQFNKNHSYQNGGAIAAGNSILNLTDVTFSGNYASAYATAWGGAIAQSSGNMTLSDVTFSGNRAYVSYSSAYTTAWGGAIAQSGGNMTLSDGTFSGNYASAFSTSYTTAWGGAIAQSSGNMTLSDVTFSGNYASATSYYRASTTAWGGAIAADNSILNLTDVTFTGNYASTSTTAWGGAIALSNSTMNYLVSKDKKIVNAGNKAQSGGFIYLKKASTATFDVQGTLTVGDDANKDSIAGTADSSIVKQGSGTWTINSDIAGFIGKWNLAAGSIRLERIVRNITLDNWTIGVGTELHLSALDDTITMGMDKKIGTINLGGGSDTINTGGYHLSGGNLQVSKVTLSGGGRISSDITTRTAGDAFDITLKNVTLSSTITGGNGDDVITITQSSTLGGVINLGNGSNVISAAADTKTVFESSFTAGSGDDTLNFAAVDFKDNLALGAGNDKVTLTGDSSITGNIALGGGKNIISTAQNLTINGDILLDNAGETRLLVYNGASLDKNELTLYSNAETERITANLDWSNVEGLDKVRIVVSSDHTFSSFEFAVELYNQTKAFTLNVEKGYFLQFQAQDEDGWAQRLLPDVTAPSAVSNLSGNANGLSWDAAYDDYAGNGVKQYNIQLASDDKFTDLVGSYSTAELSYAFNNLNNGTYYVRIQAEDYTGNLGEWSDVISINVDCIAPSTPVGLGSSVSGNQADLSWNAATDDGGIKTYEYRIASDNAFENIVFSGAYENTTGLTLSDLSYGTYYWQVRAIDTSDNVGQWSLFKSFKIGDVVAPTAPADLDYQITDNTVLLVWQAGKDEVNGSGLAGYEIELASDSGFVNIVKKLSNVTDTQLTLSNLLGNCYVRVRCMDNSGNASQWSNVCTFTMAAPGAQETASFVGNFSGEGGKDMLLTVRNGAVAIYDNSELWGSYKLEDGWKIVGTADINGDGKTDILRKQYSGLVIGDLSNGNGTFTPQVLNSVGSGWGIEGTGDFNGDGVGDVLIANPTAASDGNPDYPKDQPPIGLLGYWKGGTEWTLINGYSPEWEMIATGDFNNDGKTDMLWRNEFVGAGDLTYNAYCAWVVDNANDWRMVSVANPDEWDFLCSGDFNADGCNDIAMINGDGVVGIWGVNDGYMNSWSILSAVDTATWELAGVGDFNGDGTDDIAWCNTESGLTGYWQVNNKQMTAWQNIATVA